MKSLPGLISLLLIVLAAPANADSWALPTKQTYEAPGGEYRFTVTPRELSSQLDYFEDAVEKKDRPGQRLGGLRSPLGLLEKRDPGGEWRSVWQTQLVNDVAPVEAVVSSSGNFVATLDNWHSVGLGTNVVVLYDRTGRVVRSLALPEFLPEDYIRALPHSISSLRWRGDTHFDDANRLIVPVVIPSDEQLVGAPTFVEFSIDPTTGRATPASEAAWRAAREQAKRVAASMDLAEKERKAFFTRPLTAPIGNDEREWHQYLGEAFFRLDPEWADYYPAIQILRDPKRDDYKASETWLREALLEIEMPADVMMIASPASSDNLVRVLGEIVPTLRPNTLAKARIYIAVPSVDRDRVNTALAPTGAKIIYVDPAKAIPQRPERMAELLSK
jgi:hypothetical protein